MGSGTKPVINSWEATYLIRQGLSDLTLMKRYSISAKGLESLFSKLVSAGDITQEELEQRALRFLRTNAVEVISTPVLQPSEKITINAAEAVDCIRSGMTDQAIMEKYNLSTRGLDSLFKKLVTAGEIEQDELDTRKNVLEWAEIAFVHMSDCDTGRVAFPLLLESGTVPKERTEPQPEERLDASEEFVCPYPPPVVRFARSRAFFGRHKAVLAAGGGLLAGMFLLAAAFSIVTGVDYALDATLFWWRKTTQPPKVEDSLREQADRTAKVLKSIAKEAATTPSKGSHTAFRAESYEDCMKSCEDEVDVGDHLDRVLLMYCRRECSLRRSKVASGIRRRFHQPAIQF